MNSYKYPLKTGLATSVYNTFADFLPTKYAYRDLFFERFCSSFGVDRLCLY